MGAMIGYNEMKKDQRVYAWIEKVLKCVPLRGRDNYKSYKAIKCVYELLNKY